MTIDTGKERRVLNEGIESAFITAAGQAAAIRTYYQTKRGVLRDLFEEFYFNVAILYDLTGDLSEMQSSDEAKQHLENWLDLPEVKNEEQLDVRCREGIKAFREYKIALNRNGVLTLPSG